MKRITVKEKDTGAWLPVLAVRLMTVNFGTKETPARVVQSFGLVRWLDGTLRTITLDGMEAQEESHDARHPAP